MTQARYRRAVYRLRRLMLGLGAGGLLLLAAAVLSQTVSPQDVSPQDVLSQEGAPPQGEAQDPVPDSISAQDSTPDLASSQTSSQTSALEGTASLPDPVYFVRLAARFDDETQKIHGSEVLRWQNTASVPVEDLWFHHYLNAFRNNRSTFMKESGGRLRGDDFDGKRWGWIEVSSLRLADGTDLKRVEEFRSPDDGNPEDRTVARYSLPAALAPGEWIELTLDFEAQLPTIFARTGVHQEYVLAGQWFPKIAVFEDVGLRGRQEAGWNCHQFHAHSEFYADFGNYDVTLTLPEKYRGKIGATGELVEEKVVDGQVNVRFVQAGVHDFAWTADPRYLVIEDLFDPAQDVPKELRDRVAGWLEVPADKLALQPVAITLLLQPQRAGLAEKYIESAKAAIRGLGLRLGPYPYSTLTVVDPSQGAGGSGGMEYPTFITGGSSALMTLPGFRSLPVPELVTIHEFAHQFFYGMVASNEFEESWMDEGMTDFYESEVLADYFPPPEIFGLPLDLAAGSRRAAIWGGDFADPIVTPSWGFYSRGSYGASSYGRPAATLEHLKTYLGPAAFHQGMRAYFQRYRFRHPTTADFETTFSQAVGQDLSWFFRQALHSTRELDYSVRSVRSREVEPEEGFFGQGAERVEKGGEEAEDGAEQADSALASTEAPTAASTETPEEYETIVLFYREGDFRHPVTLELTFEDGEVLRRSWDGEKRWYRWREVRPVRVAQAVVDPEGKLHLDINRFNNGLSAEPQRAPAAKILANVSFWLQNLFLAMGLFA